MDELIRDSLSRIERRLETIDSKLDVVTERSVRNDTSIMWLKIIGGAVVSLFLSACGWFYSKLI